MKHSIEDLKKRCHEKNFCALPFTQLMLNPNGDAHLCCTNQYVTYGNLKTNTLDELWNGEKIQKIRQEFLEGNPQTCRQQMNDAKCHLDSARDGLTSFDLHTYQTQAPIRLDLRLNSKCNLKCIMCNVWQGPDNYFDSTALWTSWPKEVFPNLKEIDLLGGEPFIQDDTIRLIKEVLKYNKDCLWSFSTNGSYVIKPELLELLSQIKIRWIQISLDSFHPETYKKIRQGGDFNKVIKNILLFSTLAEKNKNWSKNVLVISMCIHKYNWKEVPEFVYKVFQRFGAYPILQFVYYPPNFSLISLPADEKRKVIEYFERFNKDKVLDSIILPLKNTL